MKKIFSPLLIVLISVLLLFPARGSAQDPPRLKRADSFLGIHLDFHARTSDQNIGQNTTPEMVNTLLDLVKPDYIQIDCKGHPGCSSYPTKVGNHGNNFIGDPLKIWRRVTADRGVALYMHYSGVWDSLALKKHPDWAVQDANGKKSDRITSVFGPYADELLIPQLIELASDYGVDGAWIDGECWATSLDYSEKAQKAFTAQTGQKVIPTKPGDPNWLNWCQFHREAFRQYLRHYITKVHEKAPDFQIASNWAFTDHMPEPVSAPVSFISGDYSPGNSVNAARFSSRYMQTQKIGWDLMAWSFDYSGGNDKKKGNKTGVQLQREAACVLAQGGGFQAYYTQNRDGSIDLNKVKTMGEAAQFCRARQKISYRSTAIPQVVLLLPSSDHYRKISTAGSALFPWAAQWQRNVLIPILENQYSVEIYNDTPDFLKKIDDFPAIVVAEWETLDPPTVTALTEYVRNGGGLLIIGEKTAALFPSFINCQRTMLKQIPSGFAAETADFGKGKIAFIPQAVSNLYQLKRDETRVAMKKALDAVFPNPTVRVQGSLFVDVSVRRSADGLLTVHLVNTSGPHETSGVIDRIDPVGPLSVQIRTARKPVSVFIEPGHRKADFTFQNGQITLKLEKLAVHEIIAVDDRAQNAAWMKDAKYGCFMHFLPGSPDRLALVEKFDVNALADQLVEAGADYFVLTMYQNSGYFNAPNAEYERVTGYAPGEKCAKRDLILDLYNAIHPKGIKLMVYLTGQVPNADRQGQKAFGLEQKGGDRLIDIAFAQKWSKVFQEWSVRYGDKVSGWWVDGCYRWINFNEDIARIYLDALHQGNPNAPVAFNPGVCRNEWNTSEYTAGEINLPFSESEVKGQWKNGAQNQILTFIGDRWGSRNTRFSAEEWAAWIQKINALGGTVTLDMGPNWDPKSGPVGSFAPEQMEQLRTIRKLVRGK